MLVYAGGFYHFLSFYYFSVQLIVHTWGYTNSGRHSGRYSDGHSDGHSGRHSGR